MFYYSFLFLNVVHLNSNDSLALQKIVIQVTYSESWLGRSEFFLHPKQQQQPKPGAANFPDSLSLCHIFQVAVRLRDPRREDSLAGAVSLSSPRAGLGKQAGLG